MPLDKITSLTNDRVKRVVKLRAHRQRRESGVTIVEGVKEVAVAVEAGTAFKEIYLCKDLLPEKSPARMLIEKLRSLKVPVCETTGPVFLKIAYGQRQEGILGICETPRRTLAGLSFKKNPLVVVIERVEKPGNIGAILRVCDGAGVDGVIVCDTKTDLYNPNIVRASLGTVFTVPVVVCSSEEAVKFLRGKKIAICAASLQAKDNYDRADFKVPLAVVLGSEDQGLSDLWMRNADLKVKIPMRGHADSLNVSSSAAILIYESIRQRKS